LTVLMRGTWSRSFGHSFGRFDHIQSRFSWLREVYTPSSSRSYVECRSSRAGILRPAQTFRRSRVPGGRTITTFPSSLPTPCGSSISFRFRSTGSSRANIRITRDPAEYDFVWNNNNRYDLDSWKTYDCWWNCKQSCRFSISIIIRKSITIIIFILMQF
jgi:hypothetical protein